MFVAVYSFKIHPGKDREFKESWKELTQFIYRHEGSLGSRLHKADEDLYIAYAQWPDKATWENAGGGLPAEADASRKVMRESCSAINTVYELEMEDDLLEEDVHTNTRK